MFSNNHSMLATDFSQYFLVIDVKKGSCLYSGNDFLETIRVLQSNVESRLQIYLHNPKNGGWDDPILLVEKLYKSI